MKALLLALLACATACAPPILHSRATHVERAYPGHFPTKLGKTWRTPTGIAVDGEANPHEIDWVVDNVFACLKEAVPNDRITKAEDSAGLCYSDERILRYPKRTDLVVKIGAWHPSCADPRRQVLDVEVLARGCDPNKPRPDGCTGACYWRGGYRELDGGRHLHIAVPELSMFPDTLVRSITGCRDPYAIDRIKACMAWRKP